VFIIVIEFIDYIRKLFLVARIGDLRNIPFELKMLSFAALKCKEIF